MKYFPQVQNANQSIISEYLVNICRNVFSTKHTFWSMHSANYFSLRACGICIYVMPDQWYISYIYVYTHWTFCHAEKQPIFGWMFLSISKNSIRYNLVARDHFIEGTNPSPVALATSSLGCHKDFLIGSGMLSVPDKRTTQNRPN